MRRRLLFIFVFLILLSWRVCDARDVTVGAAEDLHLTGSRVLSYQKETRGQVLVFKAGLSVSIGSARLSCDRGVVWFESKAPEGSAVEYSATAYLEGNVSTSTGSGPSDLVLSVIEKRRSVIARFSVSGKVFVTAEKKESADVRELELYRDAVSAVSVPEPTRPEVTGAVTSGKRRAKTNKESAGVAKAELPYPVNISPAGEARLELNYRAEANDMFVGTLRQRFYLWQKQAGGGLLELQADNAVIWRSRDAAKAGAAGGSADFSGSAAGGVIKAIYMAGDVVMTEGQRTIEADEIYYDFEGKKALVVNAVMRNYDVKRGIPLYVRAARLRRISETKFAAEDITMTSSEFHRPQISLTASRVIITDTTAIDELAGGVSDSSYDAQVHDVRLKAGDKTIFYWPFMRSNFERPDVPIKSVRAGYNSNWGPSVETRWNLSRLLGLKEPEGTDGTFGLDYYGERGLGSNMEVDYEREDYYGRILGYVINDHGEDDLGRAASRRDIEPEHAFRGRFMSQHRQFLPDNWQLTTEVSYLSDENFLESFYRGEFLTGKEQETLVHLKRIQNNWGVSVLGKVNVNDFASEMEELPGVEHHLTGQSFLSDRLTFYSDSQVNRYRWHLGSGAPQDYFTFASERAEVDMPVRAGTVKLVPFVAGTTAYDDGSGFDTDIDGSASKSKENVWFGELGVRASTRYWKVYSNVKSQLWDLNKLRHVVKPYATAVGYTQSDSVIEQRDTLNVGISQRLQTKRGPVGKERTVDWMRLNMDVTWVNNSADTAAGPDRFIWNKPFIPLVDSHSSSIPLQDRRSSDIFGPRRNYTGADYEWRLSDTTAVLGDMYYDMQSGVVQQFNIGFSQLRWPDLSYYIGSRYLRNIEVLDEKGSNVFTFAATYKLDPRYTLVFSQQFDFDYSANIRSDIAIVRRYHRLYCGLTYSADESLDRQSIMFSIWPQGVPELAIGSRDYMGPGLSSGY